ncbi:MAG: hypothetical protein R2762_06590 [Bryobacteraceae bacterium]
MAWTLLGLLLAIVALLSIPLDLSFQLHWKGAPTASVQIRWLFGLVGFPVSRSRRAPAKKRVRRPKSRSSAFSPLRALRDAPLRACLARFLRGITAAIRLRELSLHLRLGLCDPAETGLLWGAAAPILALLGSHPDVTLDVAPEFSGETLALETQGKIRIFPAQLAWIVAMLLLSPAMVRVIWTRAHSGG